MYAISAEQGSGKNYLGSELTWSTLIDRIQTCSMFGCVMPKDAHAVLKTAANDCWIDDDLTNHDSHLMIKKRSKKGKVRFSEAKTFEELISQKEVKELSQKAFFDLLNSDTYVTRYFNSICLSSMVEFQHFLDGKLRFFKADDFDERKKVARHVIFAVSQHEGMRKIEFAGAVPSESIEGTYAFDGLVFFALEGVTDQPHFYQTYKVDLAENASTKSQLYSSIEKQFVDLSVKYLSSEMTVDDALTFDDKFVNGITDKKDLETLRTLHATLTNMTAREKAFHNPNDVYLTDNKFTFYRAGRAVHKNQKVFEFAFCHLTPYICDSTMAVQWNPERNPGPKGRDLSLLSLFPKRTFDTSIWLRPKGNDSIDIFADIDIDSISSGHLTTSTKILPNGKSVLSRPVTAYSRCTRREVKHLLLCDVETQGLQSIGAALQGKINTVDLTAHTYESFVPCYWKDGSLTVEKCKVEFSNEKETQITVYTDDDDCIVTLPEEV